MAKTTRAIPPRKIQYKDYADYLKSDKWKQVKAEYDAHHDQKTCFFCNYGAANKETKFNYHHCRYSQDWNDDDYENLIKVCEGCHDILHNSQIKHDSQTYITLRHYMSDASKVISRAAYCSGYDATKENDYSNFTSVNIRDEFIQNLLIEIKSMRDEAAE